MTELAQPSTAVPSRPTKPVDGPPLGPDSLVWKYFGDRRIALIGPRPPCCRTCWPNSAGASSTIRCSSPTPPRGSSARFPPIYRTVYGSDDDNAGTTVREFNNIRGSCRRNTRRLQNGGRYHALDPATYYWAHATFFDRVLYFTDYLRPVGSGRRSRYYQESKTWYRRYKGRRQADARRLRGVREVLGPHDRRRAGGPPHRLRRRLRHQGFPSPGRLPLAWKIVAPVFNPLAAFLTTGGMPPRTGRSSACPGMTAGSAATSGSPRCAGHPWSTGCGHGSRRNCGWCPTPARDTPGMRDAGGPAPTPPPLPSSTQPWSNSTGTASEGSPSMMSRAAPGQPHHHLSPVRQPRRPHRRGDGPGERPPVRRHRR